MANNKRVMVDEDLLLRMGINPKTLKKYRGAIQCATFENMRRFMRIIDEQDAVNRYVWYNLPCNITGQELERLLYYKGQLAFFYLNGKFYFMPYALNGTIDFYGRYNTIHPVPMTSGTDEEDKRRENSQMELLSQIVLKCIYAPIVYKDEVNEDLMENSCVLLHDYTKQLAQNIIPRCEINEQLLSLEAECFPFLRTSLILGTGVKGLRVQDASSYQEALNAASEVYKAALEGRGFVPIEASVEFQELADTPLLKAQEYTMAMQSLDNLRLSSYGLENGGLFEKKAHMLEGESSLNAANVGLVMQDGLSIRQNFCNIVNSIWGLGIWCDISENVAGADLNLDGVANDNNVGGEKSPLPQEGEE